MKVNSSHKTQIFTSMVMVLMLCVLSQGFKLPIDLRRGIAPVEDSKSQLQDGERESAELQSSSAVSPKVLAFPETIDENEDMNYHLQLRYRSQDESPGARLSQDGNAGLERFYKNSLKTQPREGEAIIFPKDVIENSYLKSLKSLSPAEKPEDDIGISARSDGLLLDNSERGALVEEVEKNYKNITNFMQSLETLAHLVRQVLFRAGGTSFHVITTTEPTVQMYDTSSELAVQEQSLYSGPKMQTQNASEECPDGMKKNRNGFCQKPSRRLVS